MKANRITLIVVVIGVLVSTVACSSSTLTQPTATLLATYTPQPTYTPYPTSTPFPPAEIPSTEVLPTVTFPATVMVNGVDPVKILESNGFIYAGGSELGGCTSGCAVYDNKELGLSVYIYADGTMTFSVSFGTGIDVSEQVPVTFDLIKKIFGSDINVWINSKNESVFNGTPQEGRVGKFSTYMEFYKDLDLLVIAIAPIN